MTDDGYHARMPAIASGDEIISVISDVVYFDDGEMVVNGRNTLHRRGSIRIGNSTNKRDGECSRKASIFVGLAPISS